MNATSALVNVHFSSLKCARAAVGCIFVLLLAACQRGSANGEATSSGTSLAQGLDAKPAGTSPAEAVTGTQSLPPWKTEERAPPASRGMVWIPRGVLIAGTAPERLPRKADEEMKGEQVVLDGFYVDEYAYPNEQGAIPMAGVTNKQAETLCSEKGKRLCSELEWERVCKGPRNTVYEYGDHYQAATCGTGNVVRPLPSGLRYGCRSEFGVFDMHGGLFEWTSSPFGRGQADARVAVRGGNASDGELVGRCANVEGRFPSERHSSVGFRCCSGPRNEAEVELNLDDGPALRQQMRPDPKLVSGLESRLPAAEIAEMKKRGMFRFDRVWAWKPIANEDLVIAGGCAGIVAFRRCGVLIVRRTLGRTDVLEWVPSGVFAPAVRTKRDPERILIYGGDKRSHFRIPVEFTWGKLLVGELDRSLED